MAIILNIETSTEVCSVALGRDGITLAVRQARGFIHAEKLVPFVNEIFDECGMTIHSVDAVAVSGGPGSYTGLRIGVSTAKGYCYAADKPLIAVPTLLSMAAGMKKKLSSPAPDTLFIPMIDARRMEVYTATYNNRLEEIEGVHPEIITRDFVNALRSDHRLLLFGDGADKTMEVLKGFDNISWPDYVVSAEDMISVSEERFAKQQFENLSLYEPNYLKAYVAGKRV